MKRETLRISTVLFRAVILPTTCSRTLLESGTHSILGSISATSCLAAKLDNSLLVAMSMFKLSWIKAPARLKWQALMVRCTTALMVLMVLDLCLRQLKTEMATRLPCPAIQEELSQSTIR